MSWIDEIKKAVHEKDENAVRLLMKDVNVENYQKIPEITSIPENRTYLKNFLWALEDVQKFCADIISHKDIVDILIKLGCPLVDLIRLSKLELLKSMLESGVSSNEKYENYPIVHELISSRCNSTKFEWLKLLLQYKVDLHMRDDKGNTALHVFRHDMRTAKFLIDSGADVNSLNYDGKTPLHFAIFDGKYEAIIWFLLENGAVLKPGKHCHHTALHMSPNRSRSNAIDHLLYCEIDIDSPDENGNTMLHHAMKSSNMEFAKVLIQRGANITRLNHDGLTALQLCLSTHAPSRYRLSYKNAMDVMEICFDLDFNIEQENSDSTSTIFHSTFEITSRILRSRFRDSDINVIKPILKALAKLESKGVSINETYLSTIENEDFLKLAYEDYKNELMELKDHKIYKNTTLFNILTDSFNDLFAYAMIKELNESFQKCNLKEKFPFYSSNILRRLNEAKVRYALMDKTSLILFTIFKYIPLSVIRHCIVSHLSKSDILRLTNFQ